MSAPAASALQVSGGVGAVEVDLGALLDAVTAFARLAECAEQAAWVAHNRGFDWQLTLATHGQQQFTGRLVAVIAGLDDLGRAAGHVADLLTRSVHIYRSTDGMLLDPLDRATLAVGRAALGSLQFSVGQRAAAGRQFGAAATDLTDSFAWLVGTPLEAVFAALAGDGTPVVHDLGADTRAGATTPVRGLAGVIAQLALRNTGHHGEISVSFVVGADGRTRAIVDIPGTKSWNPVPTGDVTNVGTDALAINGAPTAYEDGVLQAMTDAGVPPDMPVLLVGHSLGGIIAVNAARTATRTGRFDVTHVVTAGAPIGRVVGAMPRTVSVLALENTADVVPATDGIGNPAKANIVTVQVASQQGSVGGNHDLGRVYQPEAAAADASDDPSIEAFVTSADGFLEPRAETTHAYWVTRG